MKELLIVETRDAAEHKDPERMAELAAGMAEAGVPATMFLAENGVFNALGVVPGPIDRALAAGVSVAADAFALAERGIRDDQLRNGVTVGDVDLIVDKLGASASVIWR
jgi:hypothetical protein